MKNSQHTEWQKTKLATTKRKKMRLEVKPGQLCKRKRNKSHPN